MSQESSVSAPRFLLPHQRIPPPMVAAFGAGQMSSEPMLSLLGCQIRGLETADVVGGFLRVLAGALLGFHTPDNHRAAGARKIHCHAIGGEGVQGLFVDAAVT